MTVKESAQKLVSLANDGFEATLKVFSNIASETIGEFGDVRTILNFFKTTTKAFEFLLLALRSLQKITDVDKLAINKTAEEAIELLYPSIQSAGVYKGQMVRTLSQPNQALFSLVAVAKKYRELSIIAEKTENLAQLQDLKIAAFQLKEDYDAAITWAQTYPEEFKPLQELNHVEDIFQTIAEIEHEGKKEPVKKEHDTLFIPREILGH